ncbi:MAG: amidase, partial [Candidatus Methylomirabilis sp.]|nr:amidase [Deltaproteobacteria bacterium]
YKVVGPLARRVADLKAVMPYLAQPDGVDASVDGPPWGAAPEYDPRKLNVYWFESNGIMPPTREVREAVRKSATALADMGFRVRRWRPKGIEKSLIMWVHALETAGGPKFIDTLGDFEGVDLWGQWRKALTGRSDHILPCLALATVERVILRIPSFGKEMTDHRHALRAEIEGKLGLDGVILCPAFHRPAPRHGLEGFIHTLGFSYTGGLNPMELPATAVPTGFSRKGLPLGVQVAGARNNDHLTLYVAERIEEAFGGWKPGAIQGANA